MKYTACPHCNGTGKIPDDRDMGARKRAERVEAGVSLRMMAYRMGVSPAYLSDLELGRRRWGAKQIERFADALP